MVENGYFDHARREVLPFLPKRFDKVVDVGGSSGGTLSAIREVAGHARTICLDADERSVQRARAEGHEAICCDLNSDLPDVFGDCDVVLLLDILEHLTDPWALLSEVTRRLRPQTTVIVSLPNVRYWEVSLNLTFRGRWDLQDAGVLDRTHLRFFTRDTGAALVRCGGLKVNQTVPKLGGGCRYRLINIFTLGAFKDFLSAQYLYVAVKS